MTISNISKIAIAFIFAIALSGISSIQADDGKGRGVFAKKGGEGHEGKGKRGPGAKGDRRGKDGAIFGGLNLSDEQKAAIQKIMEEAKANRDENKDGSLREAMKAAREAGDKEKMAEIMKQVRAKHEAKREAFRAKIEKILTPEQLEQLRKKRAEMKAKFGDRDGKGRFGKGKGPRGGKGTRGGESKGAKAND